MRNLESSGRRKALDDISESEILRKSLLKQYGNQKETLQPDDMEFDELLKRLEEIKTSSKTAESERKISLLKERGLFTEQEAGKATIDTSLENKEKAQAFEKDLLEKLRELQEKARNL